MTGSMALVAFWVPLITRKGRRTHRVVGLVFAYSMMVTALTAIVLASIHLLFPSVIQADTAELRHEQYLFLGWMMLYLGVLALVLIMFGLKAVRNKGRYHLYKTPSILFMHGVLALLALWIFYLGWSERRVLLIGVAFIAFLMVPGNIRFILQKPGAKSGGLRREWLYQHFSSMIGAGIAGYSAFLSFGAAMYLPTQTFNPFLWTIPTILGVSFMLWLAKRQPRHD
ncbi:hypothetical protein CWE09_04650 [Aliidiomarina minuta]|uniref:DUF2306 domain-containing protein n=2 Tax=Aliidiomarina minuta TaxID=880057 RepID=A0A432W7G0_9GAMM|nr:hypothetical protein CWE09_04650 [Aliidiomarina minuta]